MSWTRSASGVRPKAPWKWSAIRVLSAAKFDMGQLLFDDEAG
jgi:hypothetical protein